MLAALLGLTAPLAWPATDPQVSRLYEDALSRFEKKDLPGAIIQLKNALKIEQNNLSVQLLLAKALLANGDLVQADVAFAESLRLGVNRAEVVVPMARASINQGKPQAVLDNPQYAISGLPIGVQYQLLLMKAAAAGDLGDARAALKFIDDARVIDAVDPGTWMAEVPIRVRARQYREALAAAEKAVTLAPGAPEPIYSRGEALHVQGNLLGALASYDKALTMSPAHVEARVARAGLLIDLQRVPDAARDIAELGRIAPNEPRSAYLRSLLAEREGKTAEARAALNQITALLDPVPIEFLRYRPQMLMLGGLAHYGLNQREKARPYLEILQRLQPASTVAKLLANIYLAEKNVDRAIESLDTYLKAAPGDSQAMLLLASAHMSQGQYARATQIMQDALKQRDDAALRTALGLSLVGGGRFTDAVGELEASLKKDPNQLQAGSALVSLDLHSKQLAKAMRVADNLVKQHGNNAGVQNLLGTAKLRNSDTAAARAAFEQASKIDPAYLAPQMNLARLEIVTSNLDAAAARLSPILAKDGKNLEALGVMAHIAERRGQFNDAQRLLEKAEDLSGVDNTQPGLALLDFHMRQGKPEQAREALKRLTSKSPEALPVLLAVGRISVANNDATTARSSLSRAANTANYNAPVLVQIALMQLQVGHFQGAAYSLDKALNERPDYAPAQALRADVDIRQGEPGKAEQRARQLLVNLPKLGVGHSILGDVASARGQRESALEAYRRAHQLDQTSDSLLRVYAATYRVDPAGAARVAEQWLKTRPADITVRRAVADGYLVAGDQIAARSSYETLLKTTPDDAEALNNLANVLLTLKDPGALRIAESALAQKPGAAHIIGTAGWAAFKAGQTERSIQLLRDARLRDPNNADTRYFLGAVLASMGRGAEAREELSVAAKGGRGFVHQKDAEQLLTTLR